MILSFRAYIAEGRESLLPHADLRARERAPPRDARAGHQGHL